MIMKKNIEANFENIIKKLSNRFDSNPYSLSRSELKMLKWFSQNPGYLGKKQGEKRDDLIKTSLFTTFIKKNLQDD